MASRQFAFNSGIITPVHKRRAGSSLATKHPTAVAAINPLIDQQDCFTQEVIQRVRGDL